MLLSRNESEKNSLIHRNSLPSQALPLPVTSLLPIVTFPLLGIMNTGQVCMNYFSETVVMFIGGLMVGLAVEYSNLHKRIALRVLLSVGTDPKWFLRQTQNYAITREITLVPIQVDDGFHVRYNGNFKWYQTKE